jgi:hypothetical protein
MNLLAIAVIIVATLLLVAHLTTVGQAGWVIGCAVAIVLAVVEWSGRRA